MRGRIRPAALPLTALLAACGGGGPVVAPEPPEPAEVYPVVAVVFYDENGNGLLDASEAARVPSVEVNVAGRTARSETLTGRAVIQGVPAGTHAVTVRARSGTLRRAARRRQKWTTREAIALKKLDSTSSASPTPFGT